MTETQNLKLKKPDTTDFYNIQDFNDNADVLDTAITELKEAQSNMEKAAEGKADAETLTAHTDNKNNPHNVTKMQIGLGNVENKSSKDIRSEITKEDINAALGYTPTEYTHPTYTARTGVPTANQTPAFGATFSVTQPVSDGTGHITGMTTRTVKIPNTAASANAAGLMNTGAQTFAGNKSFNGVVDFNGASAVGTAQGRNIYAGTTDLEAGVSALETGTIYIVYE